MKSKPKPLDCTIERDIDRLTHVCEVLTTTDKKPSPKLLEYMATYILRGKDENGMNSIQRGEVLEEKCHHGTYQHGRHPVTSLDALLENPAFLASNLQPIGKQIYKKRVPTRPSRLTDADIPGMVELWKSIDYFETELAIAKGELPAPAGKLINTTPLYIYNLKHWAANLRLHQYYLRDAYKPTIQPQYLRPTIPQPICFDSDASYWVTEDEWRDKVRQTYLCSTSRNIEDYEHKEVDGVTYVKWVVAKQTFNWEDPFHVRCLINHYSAIYEENYDRLEAWGRTLIFDFDSYIDRLELPQHYLYTLIRYIDGANYNTIAEEIQTELGITIAPSTLSTIICRHIPRMVADLAHKDRVIHETPQSELWRCPTCGRFLPLTRLFYTYNKARYNSYNRDCKDCERRARKEKKKWKAESALSVEENSH